MCQPSPPPPVLNLDDRCPADRAVQYRGARVPHTLTVMVLDRILGVVVALDPIPPARWARNRSPRRVCDFPGHVSLDRSVAVLDHQPLSRWRALVRRLFIESPVPPRVGRGKTGRHFPTRGVPAVHKEISARWGGGGGGGGDLGTPCSGLPSAYSGWGPPEGRIWQGRGGVDTHGGPSEAAQA